MFTAAAAAAAESRELSMQKQITSYIAYRQNYAGEETRKFVETFLCAAGGVGRVVCLSNVQV